MKNMRYIAAAFLVSGMLTAQNIDINAMPKAGATPVVNIVQPKTFQLKNGLQVLVVENSKLPRVNISLGIDRMPIYEGNITGVGTIMADQLGKGTKSLTKEEFNKKVDFLGAHIGFSDAGANANTLSKYFTQVLELMADSVINPRFSVEEIENSKERQIEGLKVEEKSAEAIANRVSNALAYGKNTARGEFITEESIQRIGLKDVQDFYQKYYTPNTAYLVIVGDVKYDEVKKLVEKNFKNWKKSNIKLVDNNLAKNLTNTEINIVDVPNAVQSVIKVGNLSTLKMKDPLFFAGRIANYVLGGGGEARLFMNLREKNGFTYGAYSTLSTDKDSPYFEAEASVRNEVTDKAVVEFMNELRDIATITPQELANAKEKLKGNFIMSLESPETVAEFALSQKINDLPSDFYTNYLKSIDKVSVDDVARVAKENILPNQARIFIAGKASDILEGVEKLGYPVKFFDKDANPTAKPEIKKIDANITVASIGQKYIDAIGGKANAEKINSLTMNATSEIQGMTLEMVATQAKGGKSIIEMKMMGQTMQKIAFDGKEGYIQVQGQKMPLPEDVKAEMLNIKEVFPELDFVHNKTLELKGIDNINGEEVYAVKSSNKTYYYSTQTGLKVGELSVQKAQGQEVIVPTYFSDYKEVNSIKLPFKQSTNMGGMDVIFEVKSYEINKAKDADFK